MISSVLRQELESAAQAYLASQLGPRAPRALHFAGLFDERPLDGEGRTALFTFRMESQSSLCGDVPHYVAVGETEANYFPAYGLDADAGYSFHVGTRFMLVMGIQLVDAALEPPAARPALLATLAQHAPGAAVQIDEMAALLRCEDEYYAVYRIRVDGEPYMFVGAECPPGVYPAVQDRPPQAVLRLHLGQLIRREARSQREATGTAVDRVVP
ncbi:MAG: hypothetical protein LC135_14345 [Phycisphaerae bacterium]|jgi:hypothetical protein|nr:hypothetical protein [Phycisphaerae bacterium]MCZ2401029.1 hypothetical protein [Phycisphaerae bacterium]NUQ50013.1 hypothetical protein [Phycisphaerae bacterium]